MKQANGPPGWGDREEIKEIAERLRQFLPGAKTMNNAEIMAFAQLCRMTGLNPFRGEVSAWDSKGDGTGSLMTKEHYALVIRWARAQEGFNVRYLPVEAAQGDTAYHCHLLRQSDRALLGQLLASGVDYQEALEWATTTGVGIVRASEKAKKAPPKGKDWDWLARKRALEDAITEAYGMPGTDELARQSWIVEDTVTIPGDWEGVTPEMIPAEREALALYNAKRRERPLLQETARESVGALFGEAGDFDEGETGLPEEIETVAEVLVTMPQEPETGGAAEELVPVVPEMPETVQETPGKSETSAWHRRTGLIQKVGAEIGYFGNVPHVLNALKEIEQQGHVSWGMDDETLFLKLAAYAKMRANEKAAGGPADE